MTDGESNESKTGVIDVAPGGGVSFDALGEMDEVETNNKAAAIVEEVNEDKAKAIAEESIAQNGEVTEEAKVRIIKALAGESEIDIPENAIFKHKDLEFTTRDLLDSAMAQPEIDRRFNEIDKEKTKLKQERDKYETDFNTTNANLKRMLEMSANGDHWGALQFMAELAGEEDTVGYQKKLVDQALDIADKFGNMDDDQREAFWRDQKNKYLETQHAKELKQIKTKLEAKEEEDKARRVLYSNNITETEFSQAYEFLKKEGAVKELQGLTTEQAAQRVCNFVKDAHLENRIIQACTKVDKSLLQNRTLLDSLFKLANHNDSTEDLIEILKEYKSDSTPVDDDDPVETPSKKGAPRAVRSEKADSKGKKKPKADERPRGSISVDDDDEIGFDDLISQHRGM